MYQNQAIHQSNPDKLPDADFFSGSIHCLVPGNEGRLLDHRRTPVRIHDVEVATGQFVVEIMDFEDKGARWKIPVEDVSRFQFHVRSAVASDRLQAAYAEMAQRFDRTVQIPCDSQQRERTYDRMAATRQEVGRWLETNSQFLQSGANLDFTSREGNCALCGDCEVLMKSQCLLHMDTEFATQFVSNPYSGELVKGHRIVLAEMGIVEYSDKVVRDPGIFHGDWSKARRADHILLRMAFLREVLAKAGHDRLIVYRGLTFDGNYHLQRQSTFVSATFRLDVAMSLFTAARATRDGALFRQRVPASRLFMSHLETRQMNHKFREAEAVLLFDGDDKLF